MAMTNVARARCVVSLCCACGLLTLAGCGGQFKLVPVAGAVTVNGEPLNQFRVSFVPDTAKGNTTPVSCLGRIQGGRFELQTMAVKASDGGAGAPLGWYKVVLVTGLPGDPEPNFDAKFADVNTTPLSVEVVENPEPGRYDLKLTGPKNVRAKPQADHGSPLRKQQMNQQNPGGL